MGFDKALYFKGSNNNKLAISTTADRSYGRVLRAEWLFMWICKNQVSKL